MRHWQYNIDFRPIITSKETTTVEAARNLHAYLCTWRLRNKRAVESGYIELDEIIDILAIQKDQPSLDMAEFNMVLEELYQWCDNNAVWVKIHSSAK